MRKMHVLAGAAAMAATALAFNVPSQAQPYSGPGMMGGYGGYGPGYGMMGGYSGGYVMGPGYGGYGHGPGMMYGYSPDGRSYRGRDAYRGQRLCWHQTGSGNAGYYAPCRK